MKEHTPLHFTYQSVSDGVSTPSDKLHTTMSIYTKPLDTIKEGAIKKSAFCLTELA